MSTANNLKLPIMLMKLTCFGYLGFALLWWSATIPSLDLPARLILDISDWPIDGGHDNLGRDARFITAIGSGLLAGLSFLLLLVVVPEIDRGNTRVVRGTIIGLLGWYVVDSLVACY